MKNQNFKIPKNLLAVGTDAKTSKGQILGIFTAILYLAPWKIANEIKNVCAHASKGCVAACLYTAGRGKFSNVQLARVNKTIYFFNARLQFLNQLKKELTKLYKKYGKTLVVRLNGTSDLPFQNLKLENGLNIFETFEKISFYDYTKDVNKVLNNQIKNYHLTFSVDERDISKVRAKQVLKQGKNIAVVVNKNLYLSLTEKPTTIKGIQIIDGDKSDLRLFDPKGIVVLKAKGEANNDETGFVFHTVKELESLIS